MIECPVCHINNDERSRFCVECGHRFPAPGVPNAPSPSRPSSADADGPSISYVTSQSSSFNSSNSPITPPTPSATPNSSTYMDNNNQPPNNQNPGQNQSPQKRQRLHSPMLGGDDPDDDAYATHNDYEAPKSPKTKSGLLRSPLLGGGGGNAGYDEDSEPVAPSNRPGKAPKAAGKPSHLRSPLLGGSADDEDDYEEDFPLRDKHSDRVAFPHRKSSHLVDAPEPAPGSQTGSRPHLRSPLLQGDDEFEDGDGYAANNQQRQAPSGQPGKPAKLHSPLFGKHNGVYDYEDEDDTALSVNDNPNALRSPLLAARGPIPQDLPVKNPPPAPRVQPPAPQQPAAQAAPASAPKPVTLPPIPSPRPMTTQPPALGTPLPMTPAIPPEVEDGGEEHNPFARRDLGFPNPMPGYSQGMPQPPAPLPTPTGFPATAPAPAPAPVPVVAAPVSPAHIPAPAPTPKAEPKLKSKLLSSSDDSYSDDRDDYRGSPSPRSSGYQDRGHTSSGGSSGPIMVLVVPVLLVTLGKAWFLFTLASNNQLFISVPMMVDQFGQFVLMIALLIYGFTGNKR